jgi:acyl-CoA synthetase (AMP-forming)/AMP-acid ligase II
VDPSAVIEHVKGHLAGFKAPRRVRFVPSIGRSPAGKVDYARHRAEAAAWAGGLRDGVGPTSGPS